MMRKMMKGALIVAAILTLPAEALAVASACVEKVFPGVSHGDVVWRRLYQRPRRAGSDLKGCAPCVEEAVAAYPSSSKAEPATGAGPERRPRAPTPRAMSPQP